MNPLVTVEQFLSRIPLNAILPLDENDEPDTERVEIALRSATGVIVAHLPWLLEKETGEIGRPIDPQFADALEAVCIDIAHDRLTDTVTGSENARNKYKESLALLEKINRERQGGLEGPSYQTSEVVYPGTEGIPDGRFFKKGGVC